MDIKEHTATMLKLIELAQKNPDYELECLVKSNPSNKITDKIFNNVIKKVKGIPGIKLQSNSETLDIFLEDHQNMRYTINGNLSIGKYCKTNNLSTLDSKNYSLISKRNIDKLDIGNYNMRFNLKKEESRKVNLDEITDWAKMYKFFRYKKRFSYITEDQLFSFDLTVVKSSNKITKTLPNTKKPKKHVQDFLKKFVIKTDKDKNFNTWWDSLKGDDMVEIKGKTIDSPVSSKTLQASNVLTNDFDYEIELEYLGNKINHRDEYNKILDKIITNFGTILQAVQQNSFIISNAEKQLVRNQLKKLFGTFKFSGPQNITLELKHLVKHDYVDYSKVLSIRRNYSVTEKADGERNICVVLDDGRVYFINRKNEIKSFGCILENMKDTIFDGELITTDKDGKHINLFAIFDLYFYQNTDLRNRVLIRTDVDKSEGMPESRQEVLNSINLEENLKTKYDVLIKKKKYYYGDVSKFDDEVHREILKYQEELRYTNKSETRYMQVQTIINELVSDTKIFKEIKKVMDKEYIYKTDGLVFTPINLGVGDEMNGKPPKFDGRWNKLFKWKPPEENTIDFRVEIKKLDGEDEIRYKEHRGKVVSYKVLILNVGYKPDIHTRHNSCRVMNEDLTFKDIYGMVPFQPHNPYVKNIELAYIPIINGVLFTQNKEIIKNDLIVEFSYQESMGEGFCWKPLRTRNNFMPNDFITASNVWRSIHEPITKESILTGNLDVEINDETYYFNTDKRSKLNTKPLADFHSYIKKSIITKYSNKDDNLLDVSCGRGGDLNHWLDSNLNLVVGIDINRNNLENVNNGVCNRIMDIQQDRKENLLKNILIIWGDSSKLISNGSAAKDDLNKFYLDVLYNSVELVDVESSKLKRFYGIGSGGFNVISCQFAIHYFFESMVKLDIFLQNISDNLNSGGRFIGTCLDGSLVFQQLSMNSGSISISEKGNLLCQIVQKYDRNILQDDSTSVGMEIDVYIESIGKTTKEWLVNFNYLQIKALEYNLELKELMPFEDFFKKMKSSKTKYGDANNMTKNVQEFSFLNTAFVFEKQ